MIEQDEIIQTQKELTEKQNQRKASVGLIKGIISDAKNFFNKLNEKVLDLKDNTFKVKVVNQIKVPDIQRIKGSVSLVEVQALLSAINSVIEGVNKVQTTLQEQTKNLDTLKPEKIDFTSVEKAIKNIPKVNIPDFPEQREEIRVNNLSELKKYFDELSKKLNINFPEINIPSYPKEIKISNFPKQEKVIEEKCIGYNWETNDNGDLTTITEYYPSGEIISTGWAIGRVKIDDRRSKKY